MGAGHLGGKPVDPASLRRDPNVANAARVAENLGTAVRVLDDTENYEDEHDGEGGMHQSGGAVANDIHEKRKVIHGVKPA